MPEITENDCVKGHSAYIYDRGGRTRIDQLVRLSRVEWNRDRDGVSEAAVRLTGPSCSANRQLINDIAEKRHEMVIFRGEDRVWEGPIWRLSDQGSQVDIVAKDVGQYLFGQPLTRTWDSTAGTTATARLQEIIVWEMTHGRTARRIGGGTIEIPAWEAQPTPANVVNHLVVHHFPNEARTAAKTVPQQMLVGEHLAAFARTGGLDWTTVGRAIHLWDTSRSIGRTRTLTEEDFYGPIIVTKYGADHTQIAVVTGMDGAYGEAANPENLELYGPWTTLYTSYQQEGTDAPTQVELDSQATRNTSGRSPVPMEVRIPDNSTIRLDDTLTIADLVPGVQVPLLATLNARNYSQLQKIDHVKVIETAEGEEVKITLSPSTRPDSDEEEED